MNEREALALVRRILTDGLAMKQADGAGFVRWLSQEIGDLRATMRAAVQIIDAVSEDDQ